MNRRSDVAAVLCVAGPMLRQSFELPVKRARSFDRRSNVPSLMIGTDRKLLFFLRKLPKPPRRKGVKDYSMVLYCSHCL